MEDASSATGSGVWQRVMDNASNVGWAPKNWCFWTLELEKTLESPLDCKEIKPVNPKGNQSWIFIGRTDTEAEAPILWPPDMKSRLIGKDPNAGKDWGQEETGATENEMAGWHHQFNGHESEQTLGESEGQESLACYSPWGSQRVGQGLATEQQQQHKHSTHEDKTQSKSHVSPGSQFPGCLSLESPRQPSPVQDSSLRTTGVGERHSHGSPSMETELAWPWD